jgi:predicted NUDIX family NTP pyrophosphohydrolase
MPKRSAGLLAYRRTPAGGVEVLIAHPGGPLWARKDDGVWTVPKGELDGEEPVVVARREFAEEIGLVAPAGELIPLGEITQKGGKRVEAWAVEGTSLEWPPRSGKKEWFPEVDRAMWADPATARVKLNPHQVPFVDRLLVALGVADDA